MYKEFFVQSPLLIYPLLSLALFGSMFLTVVIGMFGRAKVLESRAMMALDDGGER